MIEQIQINTQEICEILRRLVEISKQDIRRYKRLMINTNSKIPPDRQKRIKREAIEAYLFLEWARENF